MGFLKYIGRIFGFGYNNDVKECVQKIDALEQSAEEIRAQYDSMRIQLDQLTTSLNHLTTAHIQLINDMGVIYSSLKAVVEGNDHDSLSYSGVHYGSDDDDDPLPN